jgi:undecaprenyl-diphosphatase
MGFEMTGGIQTVCSFASLRREPGLPAGPEIGICPLAFPSVHGTMPALDWLQQLDVALFRFINLTLRTGWLDAAMPFFNWNRLFTPVVALLVALILVKGGARGRIFVALLVLSVAVTDGIVCYNLKAAIARPRPFNDILDAHVLIRKGGNGSMPSSHAANWFAGMMVAFIYYRRAVWLMLPPALIVCFGRVYNGVHYPGDVLAGALIGTATAAITVWGADRLWGTLGRRRFPQAWARLPSLVSPERPAIPADAARLA